MRPLEPYHHAWLSAHPERAEAWLKDFLGDGFAIHHTDGNHSNDDPINLVLIEAGDHMLLHNGVKRMPWKPSITKHRVKETEEAKAERKAKKMHEMRLKVMAHDERARRAAIRAAATTGQCDEFIEPSPSRPIKSSAQKTRRASQASLNAAAAARLRFLDGFKTLSKTGNGTKS